MSKNSKMKFYCYSQNNSGGSFVHDAKAGIGHYVIVEAKSARDADNRAESIGLYFDGSGDCECCGNRWSNQWSDEGKPKPMIYDYDVSGGIYEESWMSWGLPSYIHYADGTIKEVKHVKKDRKD